jgi:ribosomal protein L22
MSPDEDKTEETSAEEPKRPRRRRSRKASADAPAAASSSEAAEAAEADAPEVAPSSEAAGAAEPEADAKPETTRAASAEDATPSAPVDEQEAEEEPKPARRRRRKADDAEVEAEEPAAPPAPAPARRRRGERPVGPPPVVRAQAKYVRSSPRKARLVCDHIRGKSVEEARAILALTPRSVAKDWSKLLESAIANAEHNHELVGEDLYVKSVHADDGPTIKRFRPRAMGRATKIRKRTSHLTILLTPKDD